MSTDPNAETAVVEPVEIPEPAIPPELDETPYPFEAYGPQMAVGDGFRFGCGLILAVVAFVSIAIIVATVLLVLAMALGLPLPFGGA